VDRAQAFLSAGAQRVGLSGDAEQRVLQLPGGLGHPLAAHPEHVGDQLLRHGELARERPKPAGEPYEERMFDV
jgi:hypothetical protein